MKFSKIKIISTIRTQHKYGISLICFLKDKRLVSGSYDNSMIIYKKSYQPQFHIKNAHNGPIYSLCVLKNGELVSSGDDRDIKVWRIKEEGYHLIHKLKEHSSFVNKVIELKDGKICSCSNDKTIKIWENYECIKTLKEHTDNIQSIIELNGFIISASEDDGLRIWDQSTCQSITVIKYVECYNSYGLSKLNDNTLIVGGIDVINFVDINSYQITQIKDQSLERIYCFHVLRNGLVFIGNHKGEIILYDLLLNQITFKNKFHNASITCLVETEDNKLISSSYDTTINIYN